MSGWPIVLLTDNVHVLPPRAKVKRSDFLAQGSYPVVSQEMGDVNGWWDGPEEVTAVEGPVVIFGDHTRIVKYIDYDFVVGADGIKILQPKPSLEPRFLYFLLLANRPRHLGYSRHFRLLKGLEFPLPPLDEQKRIVAKLDAAERKLAELRRAIILENNELLELQSATLESALAAADDSDLLALSQFASVDYGFTDSASSSKSGPKFLRITDIQDGEVNWETVPRCEISEKKLASKRLLPGDLVFARTGATTGKSYLIPEGVPEAVAASYLIRVRANTEVVTPTFLAMYFRSARYWDAIGAGTSGSAQGGFNASKLKQLQIPIPRSLETQTKVWTEVEAIASLIASKYSNLSRKNHAANELGERFLSSAFAGDF